MDKELKKRLDIVLENWGKHAIEVIAKSLEKKGVTFSGGSASELIGSAEVHVKLQGIGVQVLMNDYWVYVDQGRKPGPVSEKGRKNIERWVKRKGIFKPDKGKPFDKFVKDITFLIARKLKSKGYKGKFFIEDAITQRLVDQLAEDIAQTIEDYIIDFLK